MARGGRTYIWDAPTRLFHWLLVGLLGFSWWSAETYHMDWHRWSGLTVLGLVLFRLIWGVVGGSTARFGQFVRGPGAFIAYLRPGGAPRPIAPGHNPLGGWSVIAMLLLLSAQVGSGLFAVDLDGIESGPLSSLVDFDQGRTASAIHDLCFTLLQIIVVLHVAAILFYLAVKRRNLIGPMVTGYGRGEADAPPMRRAAWPRLIAAAAVAAGLAWYVASGLEWVRPW